MLLVQVLLLSGCFTFTSGILWGCEYKPCGAGNEHTMCRYPDGVNRFKTWCMGRGSGKREMTDDMRKCILDIHNKLRQKVATGDTEPRQPTAANMMKLRYNMEAEVIAQRWINQCQHGHDSCRPLQNGTSCGQNLWSHSRLPMDNQTRVEESVCAQAEAYYSEIEYMPADPSDMINNFKFIHDAGHYTAMMWATVREIGCAWMSAAAGGTEAGCNYCPAPNVVGGQMYEIGEQCSRCPAGAHCSKRYPGLCTWESEEDEYNDVVSG